MSKILLEQNEGRIIEQSTFVDLAFHIRDHLKQSGHTPDLKADNKNFDESQMQIPLMYGCAPKIEA